MLEKEEIIFVTLSQAKTSYIQHWKHDPQNKFLKKKPGKLVFKFKTSVLTNT